MKLTRDGENECVRSFDVEFVGGPYDGHKATGFTRVAQLPTDLSWLVCEDAFRLLDGARSRRRGSVSSIAIYGLVFDHGTPRYRYTGAVPIEVLSDLISQA